MKEYEVKQGKNCRKCEIFKTYDNFRKGKGYKDGYRTDCKECEKQYNKEWYQNNAESVKQKKKPYCKQWYQKNKESKILYSKQLYQENKEHYKQYKKQYYQANIESEKQRSRRYYQENIESVKKYKKQYYKDNAESIKKYKMQHQKIYYQKNAEVINQRHRLYFQSEHGKKIAYKRNLKRRSYKHKVIFEPIERTVLLDRDDWTCKHCGIKVHDMSKGDWNTPNKAHIDHIIPISKGGNSTPENLQVLCRTCNLSKKDKLPVLDLMWKLDDGQSIR